MHKLCPSNRLLKRVSVAALRKTWSIISGWTQWPPLRFAQEHQNARLKELILCVTRLCIFRCCNSAHNETSFTLRMVIVKNTFYTHERDGDARCVSHTALCVQCHMRKVKVRTYGHIQTHTTTALQCTLCSIVCIFVYMLCGTANTCICSTGFNRQTLTNLYSHTLTHNHMCPQYYLYTNVIII